MLSSRLLRVATVLTIAALVLPLALRPTGLFGRA